MSALLGHLRAAGAKAPWLALLGFWALALSLVPAGHAQGRFPEPVGFVNDFAGVLSPGAAQALEADLRRLGEESGAQIAVVTVPSLGDATVEEYAVGLFEQWGIGQRSEDNGVLLLVAIQERAIRVEVGYGLEPVITDGRAGRIIREEITPALREGDYDVGITRGAAALTELVRSGQPPARLEENPVRDRFARYGWVLWPLGIWTVYLLAYAARTREVVAGALWGGSLGVVLGLLLGGVLALALSAIALAALGLLLDWVLSANFKKLRAEGKATDFAHSYGGWRGVPTPWHWGGSGGGSGGFGGFGGGGSGGGGASGRF